MRSNLPNLDIHKWQISRDLNLYYRQVSPFFFYWWVIGLHNITEGSPYGLIIFVQMKFPIVGIHDKMVFFHSLVFIELVLSEASDVDLTAQIGKFQVAADISYKPLWSPSIMKFKEPGFRCIPLPSYEQWNTKK